MEEKTQSTLNIYQRILGVMADLKYIQKGDKKVNNQYTFVSHDAVTAAVHDLLVKHRIAIIPTVVDLSQQDNRTMAVLSVKFVNVDNPEDNFTANHYGYGIDNSDKGPGKAISYAFKYAILKTFCLETGDDPDNDANSKYEPKKPEEAKPALQSCISPTQIHVLMGFIHQLDDDTVFKFYDWIDRQYGAKHMKELPVTAFDTVATMLNARVKAKEMS